jgi:hypothetical protein
VPLLGGRDGRDVVAQDRALELSQLLARLQAQLVGEQRPGALIRGQRVGLPFGAIEREHELAPVPFPERLLLGETLDLRNELDMASEGEVGVDPLLDADEPELVEPPRLERKRTARRHVCEGTPAPEPEGGVEALGGQPGRIPAHRLLPLAQQSLELVDVEPFRLGCKGIARGLRQHGIPPEGGAQARDVRPQRRVGPGGRIPFPELVGEAVAGDSAAGLEQQQSQECPLLLAAQLERSSAHDRLHRPEKTEVDWLRADACHIPLDTPRAELRKVSAHDGIEAQRQRG